MNPMLVRIAIAVVGGIIGSVLMKFIVAPKTNRAQRHAICEVQEGSENVRGRPFCVFCLEDFTQFRERVRLECGDFMHKECAKIYFGQQNESSCPNCRKKINYKDSR